MDMVIALQRLPIHWCNSPIQHWWTDFDNVSSGFSPKDIPLEPAVVEEEAEEALRNEVYEQWYEGLDDPYDFLVIQIGRTESAEDLANENFIQIDYDAIADALEYDYTFVQHDGEVYVFNIR